MPAATEMQQLEMEMVQGMYDTFELEAEDPPTYSILLAPTADDAPQLKVIVCYPSEEYPETAACSVTIESIAKGQRIQIGNISKQVTATCQDNIGMHSVVLVLQEIQGFLSQLASEEEKADLHRRGEAMEAAAALRSSAAADPTICIGTALTRELFEEWSRKHNAERERLRTEEEKKAAKLAVSKLTGRQLWDNSLKSADWTLFGGDGEEEDGGEDVDFGEMDQFNEDDFDLE